MQKFEKIINFSNIIINNLIIFILLMISCEFIFRIFSERKVILNPKEFVSRIIIREGASKLNNSNLQRMSYPYIMFKGKPYAFGHNSLGYNFDENLKEESIKILFFGGSTGYNGNPSIVEIISKLSSINSSNNFQPINFSVVSSNHNQHLHSLIEQSRNFPVDLVIYYGGYNETLQSATGDPRPGFPYNFNIRNELNPELALLYKHFTLLQRLNHKTRFINKILRIKDNPYSDLWSIGIVENYLSTIKLSKKVSMSLASGKCEMPFIAIYQPYQFEDASVPLSFKLNVHQKIVKAIDNNQSIIDASNALDKNKDLYTDIVHVNQKGKEIISENIFKNEKFQKVIKSCKK